jgi:hypothetical protein
LSAASGPEEVAARYLEHLTEAAIRAIAQKIRKELAGGLSDERGFDDRRRARRTAEYATYKHLISDSHLRLVIINGLTLRALEDDPAQQPRIAETLDFLKAKWGPTAVRQAEFVQRGMLLRAIQTLEATGVREGAIGPQIETLLSRVEEHTLFVQARESEQKLGEEIRVRVLRETPNTFIVFGKGYARALAKRGVRIAMEALPSRYAKAVEETKYDYVAFIGEKESGTKRPRISWWTGEPWHH